MNDEVCPSSWLPHQWETIPIVTPIADGILVTAIVKQCKICLRVQQEDPDALRRVRKEEEGRDAQQN